MAKFTSLNIPSHLIEILNNAGYTEPTPVQLSSIPAALKGESLLAQAPTGSGKTHAFLIPILSRIDLSRPVLQALIITPTRELARQIFNFLTPFKEAMPELKVRLITGENERLNDVDSLKAMPHIAIGTPGRLLDLISKNIISPKGVKIAVLDEADMLLDMGFYEEASQILDYLESPQILVYSATLKEHLKSSLAKYVKADFIYEGGKEKTSLEVKHHFVDIRHQDRYITAYKLIEATRPYFAIIFANKKEEVSAAYEVFKSHKYKVVAYSGDLSPRERKKTMKAIRDNEYQIVIASDLLARGIDLPDVDLVISLSAPNDSDFYFHRAGRTGRYDRSGDSYLLYTSDEQARVLNLLAQCENYDFLTIKKDALVVDPIGPSGKKKLLNSKKKYSDDEMRELSITKAKHASKVVKPGYKKKQKVALEKVKRKYRKKAIRENLRKNFKKNALKDK